MILIPYSRYRRGRAPVRAGTCLKSVRDYTDLDTTDLPRSKQLEKFLSKPHYICVLIKNEWLQSIQHVNSVLSIPLPINFIKGIITKALTK